LLLLEGAARKRRPFNLIYYLIHFIYYAINFIYYAINFIYYLIKNFQAKNPFEFVLQYL